MLLIGNGRVITRDQENPYLEDGAVVISGEKIKEVGSLTEMKAKYPEAEFVDAKGGVIMPGLINAHTHIYSGLARGLSIAGNNPTNFLEVLDGTWWAIDRHLTLDGTKACAYATVLDCIRNGVTTIFDHHASFGEISGSLFAIKDVVKELGMLSPKYNPEHYEDAQFLGRGTCTVSQIFYTSPSRCAVADSCAISIDRRMTAGETWDSCLDEIRALPSVQKYGDDVKVSMYMYDRPSWTGEVYETECYFPTWINKENAAHVQALVDAHKGLFGDKRMGPDSTKELRNRPLIDKWTFSTNGVAIQGRYGIPCVGFGPGAESQAHAPNEITYKDDLVRCAAVYVAAANLYNEDNKTDDVSQFRAGKTNNDIK